MRVVPGDGRHGAGVILKFLVTLTDNIIYLLVGFALTIEIPYVVRPDLPGTTLLLSQSVNAFVYVFIVCIIIGYRTRRV